MEHSPPISFFTCMWKNLIVLFSTIECPWGYKQRHPSGSWWSWWEWWQLVTAMHLKGVFLFLVSSLASTTCTSFVVCLCFYVDNDVAIPLTHVIGDCLMQLDPRQRVLGVLDSQHSQCLSRRFLIDMTNFWNSSQLLTNMSIKLSLFPGRRVRSHPSLDTRKADQFWLTLIYHANRTNSFLFSPPLARY